MSGEIGDFLHVRETLESFIYQKPGPQFPGKRTVERRLGFAWSPVKRQGWYCYPSADRRPDQDESFFFLSVRKFQLFKDRGDRNYMFAIKYVMAAHSAILYNYRL